MKNKYLIHAFMFGMLIMATSFLLDNYYKHKKYILPKVPTTVKLSFQQTLHYSAKYEMFVDSLQYCKKSQRIRLTDSLIKYKTLLTK